jgi:hypothetical protein
MTFRGDRQLKGDINRCLRRLDELVASVVIRPPLETGDPTQGWPEIRLPAGTAAQLIDDDRRECAEREHRAGAPHLQHFMPAATRS